MSELVLSLLAGQALASFAAIAVWLTSPERLSTFAWRLAHRELRPARSEDWIDELDARSATGDSPRWIALVHLRRGVILRVRSWMHPVALWRLRVLDTHTGTLLIVSKMDVVIEVSIAANKGGPKESLVMPPHATFLFPSLVDGTGAIVTVTRSAQPVRYWGTPRADGTPKTDGQLTVRPRRHSAFSRRRRPQTAVLRPAHVIEFEPR